jgi:flagellar biosynthetic protein FliP
MMRALLSVCFLLIGTSALAQELPTLSLDLNTTGGPQELATTLQVLMGLTVLSMAPAIILMTTAFTRIVIVLAFVRQAMGTQSSPPNQVLIGLAMFLTFFVMTPVLDRVNETALQPYMENTITQEEALSAALVPMREFMFSQTAESDLAVLLSMAGREQPRTRMDVPTLTLIPAFMLSELKRAFEMGFLIYIPFLVIDMIVASVLMAMGMLMLPPPIISLPFKLLLFVLVDGWNLVVASLLKSFQ